MQLAVQQHEQQTLPHGPRLLAATAEEHRGLELLELGGRRPGARTSCFRSNDSERGCQAAAPEEGAGVRAGPPP